MSTLIGQIFGNYRIESSLGTGGMGKVFRAVHVHLGRPAAVKVLHDTLAVDPSFRARFLDEATSAASLKHDNIINIYDFGEQAGTFYLVMELITGGSLRSLLAEQTSTREGGLYLSHLWSNVDLIRQTADGLAAAHTHTQKMIHRDIKPDNLLLSTTAKSTTTVKITDFGLVRMAESPLTTRSGEILGTPAYMSPEQCQGFELDGRSDLYSLGVVLYEVATGCLPFEAKTFPAAYQKHIYAEPPPPRHVRPDLPANLESIILRCLAKRPDDRYASADDLSADLEHAMPSHPPSEPFLDTPRPGPVRPAPLPPPLVKDRIAVVVDHKELTVTPGQPAVCRVTLLNKGKTVDFLVVTVEGVPGNWVQAQGAGKDVQLYPNAQATVALTINVPKASSSRAGDYNVTIRARSRDFPEESGTADARWTVLPFVASSLGIAPTKASGHTEAVYKVTSRNEGSSRATYELSCKDDEEKLGFVFEPENGESQRRLTVVVEPGDAPTVKLRVRATKRWIGRDESLRFSVQALASGAKSVQQAEAQFIHRGLIPSWVIPAALAVLIVIGLLLRGSLKPEISQFSVSPENPHIGDEVTLRWSVARASNVELSIGQQNQNVNDRSEFSFKPDTEGQKKLSLVASNVLGESQRTLDLLITKPPSGPPNISEFKIMPAQVTEGESVTIRWRVSNANKVQLFGTEIPVPAVGPSGSLQDSPRQTKIYQLIASNKEAEQTNTQQVIVKPKPTPVKPSIAEQTNTQQVIVTPKPTPVKPVIEEWSVSPSEVTKGNPVTIRWRVSNAEKVELDPLGRVDLQGNRQDTPQSNQTYKLTATNKEGEVVMDSRSVVVHPPVPPVIAFPPRVDRPEQIPRGVKVSELPPGYRQLVLRARLQPNDVIQTVDGKPVRDSETFIGLLRQARVEHRETVQLEFKTPTGVTRVSRLQVAGPARRRP